MRAHMKRTITWKITVIHREVGVSLLELMITLGIGMILIAMATPLVNTTINIYRLRGAGNDYANLLQQTRMRAVRDDRYYPVYASTNGGVVGLWGGFNAFTDINGVGGATGAYSIAPLGPDLGVTFNRSAITLQPAGAAPNTNNLYNQFMPGIALGVVAINPNAWANPSVTVATFGPRGLPCYLAAPPPGGNCSYTFPVGGVQPVAFEVFLQNIRTGAWEAITVNPSARIREWRYNNSTATWQPLN
jgi:hypothetical protein